MGKKVKKLAKGTTKAVTSTVKSVGKAVEGGVKDVGKFIDKEITQPVFSGDAFTSAWEHGKDIGQDIVDEGRRALANEDLQWVINPAGKLGDKLLEVTTGRSFNADILQKPQADHEARVQARKDEALQKDLEQRAELNAQVAANEAATRSSGGADVLTAEAAAKRRRGTGSAAGSNFSQKLGIGV